MVCLKNISVDTVDKGDTEDDYDDDDDDNNNNNNNNDNNNNNNNIQPLHSFLQICSNTFGQ
jgi:hypothetical protein